MTPISSMKSLLKDMNSHFKNRSAKHLARAEWWKTFIFHYKTKFYFKTQIILVLNNIGKPQKSLYIFFFQNFGHSCIKADQYNIKMLDEC